MSKLSLALALLSRSLDSPQSSLTYLRGMVASCATSQPPRAIRPRPAPHASSVCCRGGLLFSTPLLHPQHLNIHHLSPNPLQTSSSRLCLRASSSTTLISPIPRPSALSSFRRTCRRRPLPPPHPRRVPLPPPPPPPPRPRPQPSPPACSRPSSRITSTWLKCSSPHRFPSALTASSAPSPAKRLVGLHHKHPPQQAQLTRESPPPPPR